MVVRRREWRWRVGAAAVVQGQRLGVGGAGAGEGAGGREEPGGGERRREEGRDRAGRREMVPEVEAGRAEAAGRRVALSRRVVEGLVAGLAAAEWGWAQAGLHCQERPHQTVEAEVAAVAVVAAVRREDTGRGR